MTIQADALNTSSSAPTVAFLKRALKWLRDDGYFVLDGPVIVQDGSAWLRIAPGKQTRWYGSLAEALHA